MKQPSIFLLLILVAFAACKKTPEGILSKGDMEDVLFDYHLVQGMIDQMDSEQRLANQRYLDAVFKKHGNEHSISKTEKRKLHNASRKTPDLSFPRKFIDTFAGHYIHFANYPPLKFGTAEAVPNHSNNYLWQMPGKTPGTRLKIKPQPQLQRRRQRYDRLHG